MLSIKGTFQEGVARPIEVIEGRDGQWVIITFLDEGSDSPLSPADNSAWDVLSQLIEDCGVETGVADLAHQHNHYLYGKPKRE